MKMFLTGLLLFMALTVSAQVDPYRYSPVKQVSVKHAAVTSAHALASDAGLSILKQGGNAIDAAIATQLALAVVYPRAGNIGGGGFLVARLSNRKNIMIDYREKAPAKATRDMYLDSAGNVIPNLSLLGHQASGVPGTVAGLFAAHKYGKLSFDKLIEPAIRLTKGFALMESEARLLNSTQQQLISQNTRPNVFMKKGGWKAGDTLVQPDLQKTLERIRDLGMDGFYRGETAQLIVAEMNRNKGLITMEDLANYRAIERPAAVFPYKGHQVVTSTLPSSSGVVLQQLLKMTESKDLGKLGFHSPEAVQLMIEAERRAYADRAQFLGDVDFIKVPVKTLVSQAYLDARMSDVAPGKAGSSSAVQAGNIAESDETTHLSIIDQWGNAVAVTTTLNGNYGSCTVVGGAGFFMNNEMDDFSAKPGVANMFGALGSRANEIAPGKRMLSSMSPTIVLKKKKPYIIVGSPGGTTITTSVYQSIVNIIDFKLSAADAVNKPKFHHQWQPDVVDVEEKDFNPETLNRLRAMGYTLKNKQIGRVDLILVNGKTIEAIGDKRGDDSAAGY